MTPTTQSISGYVVDGYISGATICIDLDNNGTCDGNEPTTTTDENGSYVLETTLVGEGFTLLAYGGVDTATGEPQTQVYRALVSIVEGVPVTNNITPLTTIAHGLYKQKNAQNPNYSYEDAKSELATALEIVLEDIQADPMQNNALFAKTQRVAQTSSLLEALTDTLERETLWQSVALSPVVLLPQNLTIEIDEQLQQALENLEQNILDALGENSSIQARADLQKQLFDNIKQLKEKIKSGEAYELGSFFAATPVTYSWTLSEWEACSGACGTDNATQNRTATCTASTGGSVEDNMCSEEKPATTQACTASICPPPVTYSWTLSEWEACSGACGTDNATQNRTATCTASTGGSVEDNMCSEEKPATSQACTASICPPPVTYSWVVGTWSTCSGACGTNNATQNRTATCTASTGGSVEDNMCSEEKPATSQACTASVCNIAPTINTTFTDIELAENNGTTNYELNISDADGDELTLSMESNDTSMLTVTQNWTNPIVQATYATVLDFNLTTVTDAFGMVRVTITVDDGEDGTTTSFDVNVTEVVTIAIKKTGQSLSYDTSGTEVTDGTLKDDGFYQAGVDHNYTRDNTNNIVTDNVTGLMWQDDTAAASTTKPWLTSANYTTCSNDTTSQACYDTSGDTAASYCQDLSLGGYTDWRLPTAEELEGIVDYGKVDPAIDTTFQNISSSSYWSSTTNEDYKDGAWYVYFGNGGVNGNGKGNNYYVRCVRAGQ